jgi:hypothetical protein
MFAQTFLFGGNKQEVGHDILIHSKQIYIVGATTSFGDTLDDTYLLVTDLKGKLLQEKIFHQPREDGGNSILANNNSLYIFGHVESIYGDDLCDASLLIVNNDLTLSSSKQFGDSLDDISFKAINLTNGNIAFCGKYTSKNMGVQGYLGIIEPNGHLLHQAVLGGLGAEIFFDIKQKTDGKLILIGNSSYNKNDTEDIYVVCADTLGNVQWQRTISDYKFDEAYGLEIINNSLYITGLHTDSASDHPCLGMLKLDENGHTLINRSFNQFNNHVGAGIINVNGNLLVASNQIIYEGGQSWLHLFDTSLNILRSIPIDTSTKNYIRKISVYENNIYGVGSATENSNEQAALFITSLSAVNGLSMPLTKNLVLRPNPADNLVSFELDDHVKKARLFLYSMDGKCLLEKEIEPHNVLDISHLPAGLYISILRGENFIANGKLVKN